MQATKINQLLCKMDIIIFPVMRPYRKGNTKELTYAGDPDSIPGSGSSPGEGIGYTLQHSWASLVAQMVKNPPVMWETWIQSWVGRIPWRRA